MTTQRRVPSALSSRFGRRRPPLTTNTPPRQPRGVDVRLAPWGTPPTPLLPKWYREEFADRHLPGTLRAASPFVQTVGDLENFWEHTDVPLERPILQSLARLVRIPPPSDCVVIPAGLDHAELLEYPLSNRVRNGLESAGFFVGSDAITVGMLLNARRIGIVLLIELMCISELAADPTSAKATAQNISPRVTLTQDTRTTAWNAAIAGFVPLFAAARDFQGAKTVGDALGQDLAGTARTLRIKAALDAIAIDTLVRGQGIAQSVINRIESVFASTRPSLRFVVEQRILSSQPRTLEAVGKDLGITRERVRQLQKEVTTALRDRASAQIKMIAQLLQGSLLPVMTATDLERAVEQTFPVDVRDSLSGRLARRMLLDELDYSCTDGLCFGAEAMEVVTSLRTAAEQLADDVGLVNEKDLQSHLPGQDWQRFFGHLVAQARLHQVRGRMALRNTGKSRVKAVVLEIGRPATKEEIAERVGMTPAQVGAHLSVIPSIARADKDRWGLVEWIDDIYEGITAEIVQRINEDGGATRLERLLEELPRLFGVSEVSVRMYARTPYFVIHNGYVSVASEPKVSLKELDDVVDGRTDEGVPYWTFGVESRFFDGYSISPFPPELARELGCEPNGTISAEVDYPQGANAVSVSWPLASTTGASVGRISDSLQRLDVKAGDRVRLLVAGPRRVEFRPSPAHKSRMERPSSDILERLKSRQQVF